MNNVNLIKKCLMTCSVLVVLLITSVWCFAKKRVRKASGKRTSISNCIAYKNEADSTMNFANEPVPVENKVVLRKMNISLLRHSFRNVQTNLLHRKAEKWFPIIEPILKANGIPDDFKYVPLVEAGFSEGRSTKGAYGPWQFMPGTARDYGLRVSKKQDDRVSLRKSTIAACKYLNGLHNEFKSWVMVAAAFNTGSPNVYKAMARQNESNYFRMHFNAETGQYVYNLIAVKEIITNPVRYGYAYHKPKYGIAPQFTNELLAVNQ